MSFLSSKTLKERFSNESYDESKLHSIQTENKSFILTIEALEMIFNKNVILYLDCILDQMDDNLSISVNNFIDNPLVIKYKISFTYLVNILKSSKELHYDKKNKMIRIKQKADLNLLIIEDFQLNQESWNNKISYLNDLLLSSCRANTEFLCKNFVTKMRKIQYVKDLNLFQINFDNELNASCALEFLKSKDINLKINQAAETYKRRVLNDKINSVSLNTEEQRKIIDTILLEGKSFKIDSFIKQFCNEKVNSNVKVSSSIRSSQKYIFMTRTTLRLDKQYRSKSLTYKLSFVENNKIFNSCKNENKSRSLMFTKHKQIESKKTKSKNIILNPKHFSIDNYYQQLKYKHPYNSIYLSLNNDRTVQYKYSSIELLSVYNHLIHFNQIKSYNEITNCFINNDELKNSIFKNTPNGLQVYKPIQLKSFI